MGVRVSDFSLELLRSHLSRGDWILINMHR